jgi:hypothetical protein
MVLGTRYSRGFDEKFAPKPARIPIQKLRLLTRNPLRPLALEVNAAMTAQKESMAESVTCWAIQ